MIQWARENPGYTFLILFMVLGTIERVVYYWRGGREEL